MTATVSVAREGLGAHPFLRGMCGDHIEFLADAATLVTMPARYRLFDEGAPARAFWLIRSGDVAVDLRVPGNGRVIVETVGRGDVLGWSWLFPPHERGFGAVTIQPVEAFELDGLVVRAWCTEYPLLGHELIYRFSKVLARRLEATGRRLADHCAHPQLLD